MRFRNLNEKKSSSEQKENKKKIERKKREKIFGENYNCMGMLAKKKTLKKYNPSETIPNSGRVFTVDIETTFHVS